jgi:hypothetical protein
MSKRRAGPTRYIPRRRTGGLAECDAAAVELCGACYDEQRVAILLDLRTLMGVVGVLDREIVQLELLLHAAEHRHVGLVQADPDHMVGLAAPARGFVDGDVGHPSSLDLDTGRDYASGGDRFVLCNARRCDDHGFHPRLVVAGLSAACFRRRLTPRNSRSM